MNWYGYLIFWLPLGLLGLIVLWLFYLELKNQVSLKIARRGFIAVLIITFLEIVSQTTFLYFNLRQDEIGKFLLPPQSDYFYQAIWMISSAHVWALAIGIILVLVLLLLKRIFRSDLVDRSDLYILLLVVLVVGPSSVVVLILASFFLMIFFLIGFSLREKKIDTRARLSLAPFLLIISFAILILSNFDFYYTFLQLLRLN